MAVSLASVHRLLFLLELAIVVTDSLLEPARTVPAHGLLSLTHVLLWAPPTCSVPAYQRAMGLQQLLQTLSASLRRAVTQPLETAERRCRIMACNLAVIRGAQLATSRDLTPLPAPELVGIPSWGIPGAAVSNDLIENGILWMAVPKKRTSHSKKRMRMAQKWLKPIRHYNFCPACGNPKLFHHLCGHCFKETMKKTAKMRREMEEQQLTNTRLRLTARPAADSEELVDNTQSP